MQRDFGFLDMIKSLEGARRRETLPGDPESLAECSALCRILTITISNAASDLTTVGLWLTSLFKVLLDILSRGSLQLLAFQAKQCTAG